MIKTENLKQIIEKALKSGYIKDFKRLDYIKLFEWKKRLIIYYYNIDGLRTHFIRESFTDLLFDYDFVSAVFGEAITEYQIECFQMMLASVDLSAWRSRNVLF